MKTRIAALAAANVIALTSPIALSALAEPTPPADSGTPAASTTATPAPSPQATEENTPQVGGWPKATFRNRTVTVTNLAPGWNVTITAENQSGKQYVFKGKAKGTSVVIEMKGLPAVTYDIWIDAGDLPANESYYPGTRITGSATTSTGTSGNQRGGLAKTGV